MTLQTIVLANNWFLYPASLTRVAGNTPLVSISNTKRSQIKHETVHFVQPLWLLVSLAPLAVV